VSRRAALIGAVAYVLAPYHIVITTYIRFAMGEMAAGGLHAVSRRGASWRWCRRCFSACIRLRSCCSCRSRGFTRWSVRGSRGLADGGRAACRGAGEPGAGFGPRGSNYYVFFDDRIFNLISAAIERHRTLPGAGALLAATSTMPHLLVYESKARMTVTWPRLYATCLMALGAVAGLIAIRKRWNPLAVTAFGLSVFLLFLISPYSHWLNQAVRIYLSAVAFDEWSFSRNRLWPSLWGSVGLAALAVALVGGNLAMMSQIPFYARIAESALDNPMYRSYGVVAQAIDLSQGSCPMAPLPWPGGPGPRSYQVRLLSPSLARITFATPPEPGERVLLNLLYYRGGGGGEGTAVERGVRSRSPG